jgi:hypothetical protein
MKTTVKMLGALCALFATTALAAEPDPHAGHHPATTTPTPAAAQAAQMTPVGPGATGGPSMMGGGATMDMGGMHGLGMSADRMSALKADLALTPVQLPLWNAFEDAAMTMHKGMVMSPMMGSGMNTANDKPMPGMGMAKDKPVAPGAAMPKGMPMKQSGMAMGMMDPSGSFPERLERHEEMMAKHLAALRQVKAALAPLYAALTPAQRGKIDALPKGMAAK